MVVFFFVLYTYNFFKLPQQILITPFITILLEFQSFFFSWIFYNIPVIFIIITLSKNKTSSKNKKKCTLWVRATRNSVIIALGSEKLWGRFTSRGLEGISFYPIPPMDNIILIKYTTPREYMNILETFRGTKIFVTYYSTLNRQYRLLFT